MFPSCLGRFAARIGEYSIADLCWLAVRQLRWLAVLAVGVVAWADLSDADTASWSGFRESIESDWIWFAVTVGATTWAFLDPSCRRLRRSMERRRLDERANYAVIALQNLRGKIRTRQQKPDIPSDFAKVLEPLLRAACFEIRAHLDLPAAWEIKANLLLLTGDDEMTVVARSEPGSPVPKTYVIDKRYPAARAVASNTTVVQGSVRRIDSNVRRPYDCVAATPLEADGRAFGAITVDSPRTNAFKGQERAIDRVLRVYAGVALLCLGGDLASRSCPNRYGK